MNRIRLYTNRTGESNVGDTLTVISGKERFVYSLTFIGKEYCDAERAEKEPRRGPAPHQKYYQKFNKGWNR